MKPNLILLHGALGSHIQFRDLAALLEPHFRVFCLNFSGHGGREISPPFSTERFVSDLLDFVEKEGLSKFHLFGFSMGGYVGLHFAARFPERVDKIMTWGTKFLWNPQVAEKETAFLDPSKIEEKVPRFAQMLLERHAPQDWKAVVRETARMMIQLGAENGISPRILSALPHQVLIGAGSEDNLVSGQEVQRIAGLLAGGAALILEGMKHPIEQADPQVLSREIIRFFEGNPGSPEKPL